MARSPASKAPLFPLVPWDLDRLPAAQLATAYADLATFVARLQAQGGPQSMSTNPTAAMTPQAISNHAVWKRIARRTKRRT